ncbi:unnamed protein product [[Actinomadura] parvosata subsp. kistnae]|uniref:Uncharacterized protein n=1 Tax=[Actinomadura] parvosata subsp. kistnae TaxID=1909395 RepID=A0A1U9ZQV9_9ACTN|nr:DUF1707 domain-containing protein [Nonomuraea sp. ATCC 55076]AQZ60334.1 hypothetical protein BKM31_01315 [Nonomuraea sp. ATCC 55076]SPL91162.1 unnamed protein product [Actinomadura parvosata subsp. kistnae]
MTDPGEVRASDAEREAVVEQLRVASVEGRLTLAELTDRTEAAYTATTHAELALLTQDLPAAGGVAHAPAPAAAPQGRKRRWFVGVMGDSKRRGTWRIDQELGAVAVMGDVLLDLREAEVRTDRVDILAVSVMGDVKIIVPDGVYVDLDGMAIMGDKKVNVVQAPPGMNVPVVRVQAYAVMGDVKVIGDSQAQPLQRGFAAWREHWRRLHGDDWREMGRQLRAEGRELRRQLRDDRRLDRGY